MYCQNRSCHRVVSKKEPSHFVYTNGECPECGGELRQLAFVLVHDCGNMMSINPQPCSDPNHGYDHIYLNKQNINDPLSWYFYCGECGDFCGNMSKRCTKCNKERVYFRPIASNSVYYSPGRRSRQSPNRPAIQRRHRIRGELGPRTDGCPPR